VKLVAYPRYKPSGVEWFGEVPEHWVPLAMRRIATRYAGGTPDRSNNSYWEDGTIPWVNSGAVNQGLIAEPSAFITAEAYKNSSARWVPKGALVMALAGQGKTKGMVAQTGIATTCNQSMAAIWPAPPTDARYL
jgi:type I restriction enzyme S subunit